MAKDLVMTFSDPRGEKSNLILKNIKDPVTQDEIAIAMDAVIASKLFSGKNGELTKKESAAVVETNKTIYDQF
ncbi:DUF2922 domain-containing protein [Clostridium tunisiense]|uniref:DUF2922 domain-containing protein n=1 Tax=Clostridium tunisiense TaxID=219748 RepID=UPI0002DE6E4A|nr:DUF2922 domain-containing protein [Clostridium tunisiense]